MAMAIEKAAWELAREMLRATPQDREVVRRIVLAEAHDGSPAPTTRGTAARNRPRKRTRHGAGDLTTWKLTRQARRLPTFVIEAAGVKTVKELATKYPLGSVFEKGKPLPAQIAASAQKTPAAAAAAKRARPTQAEARA
jgi:hypothetical protein